eukprot:211443-Amphidinium_carterae.1
MKCTGHRLPCCHNDRSRESGTQSISSLGVWVKVDGAYAIDVEGKTRTVNELIRNLLKVPPKLVYIKW